MSSRPRGIQTAQAIPAAVPGDIEELLKELFVNNYNV